MADEWTLLTRHAIVLLAIHRDPDSTMEVIADTVGLSLRWTIKIVQDLLDAGYLQRERRGKSYTYSTDTDMTLRHALVRHTDVAHLFALVDRGDHTPAVRRELGAEIRALRHDVKDEQRRLRDLREQRVRLEAALTKARAALRHA